jgi:hypothetical protein
MLQTEQEAKVCERCPRVGEEGAQGPRGGKECFLCAGFDCIAGKPGAAEGFGT